MSPNKFQAFLIEQKQQKQESMKVDWQAIKETWIKQAESFLEEVEIFLAEFQPDIKCEFQRVWLTEEYIGRYEVPKLTLHLPKETIEFVPKGALLIGARGRYDMQGSAGSVKWVLVPEAIEKPIILTQLAESAEFDSQISDLVWKLATPPPHIRYIPFNQETLLEAIMEVSHG